MTSYDEIWQTFIDNCGVDLNSLPQTDGGKYILIHNGIKKYNTYVDSQETKLTYNDQLELINTKLDDTRILILAYCMRYTFLENELISFEQVWQPFQQEVGQKFYREQINGRENTLERTQKQINQYLLNIDSYSYLE